MKRSCNSLLLIAVISILFLLSSCQTPEHLVILSGSENESLEPILKKFGSSNGVTIEMKYKGSVDIMMELASDTVGYDAVWPASSMWIGMGDKQYKVKYAKSIMISPVVFGIKKSIAEKLGFVNKDVHVNDILAAIEKKEFSFAMTSASQSNSGASAYLGFLYALLGNPQMISMADLNNPQLQDHIQRLLAGISRSSGSSGWLKDLFLKGNFDAMVNYESIVIETNKELVKQGREPLYVVYPVDGLVMSDSPLGYLNRGDERKEKIFLKLQEYLMSDAIQKEIAENGRRIGIGGSGIVYNKDVFNPDWGLNTDKILSPITLPQSDVIYQALALYQTKFRKPSLTVFCLDFSGSMEGEGVGQLKESMRLLFTPDRSSRYLIQQGPKDITIVIPFNNHTIANWKVEGDSVGNLQKVLDSILDLSPGGGTDIYSPAVMAIEEITKYDLNNYMPAVILLTDGESNSGKSLGDLQIARTASGKDIPVFSIMFGEASALQLDAIAATTLGTVFDGRKDLISAFRKVKGYN